MTGIFKKAAILMLILALAGSTAASVYAADAAQPAEESDQEESEIVWDLSYSGLKFTVPQEFRDAKGFLTIGSSSEVESGSGVYLTEFLYLTMSEEDYNAFMENDDVTIDEFYVFLESLYPLGYILSIDGGRDKEDFSQYFTDIDDEISAMYEIGKAEDTTFYFYRETYTDLSGLGEYKDEFVDFTGHPEYITANVEFLVPDGSAAGSNAAVSFETTDISGNPVSSSELFSENKVTMINIWTSWCTYCIKEMPELEELYNDLQEKGCGIIGLLYDGNEDGAVDEAKDIMETAGVTFPVVLPWDGYEDAFYVQAFPTTLFVDSEGNIVGETIIGANIEGYKAELEKLMEQLG